MDKVDFKKSLKAFYGPTKARGIHLVDVPPMRFLMIDGQGDPNTASSYADAVATLYAVAYALKFASKTQLDKDYAVPPLEGLWWSRDMTAFAARDKDKWPWTMMLMVPEWVGPRMIDDAITRTREKKAPAALDKLRVELFEEGRAIQALHTGSYDEEGPLIAKMHEEAIERHGFSLTGKHHEIYLSDPRRVAPEKLRTILRQPVK
ncbi:GyrI-like domain-containing protein [Pelagibacterium xiamenense]|uniref:GyrI-like domain-containing protein n=1 Tax=Pelagibacterium xiamenense TaxID=2901140 RepID=UPI001E64EDC2|nr:GyrI-like domain-containing protein [Pelagibacterium xiamenense]MCD7060218.1 GyrI-like domain-containing protein [Pelagibacterium xiamenense]